MANSVLTLKLFVEHNYTDIAGLQILHLFLKLMEKSLTVI